MTGAVGTVLGGRFELRRQLGAGAFGEVYEAFDLERNAVLALKRLARLDVDSFYRFKREFRAVANLAHRNLVTLHELFAESGAPYFTMELIAGVDIVTWTRTVVVPDPALDETIDARPYALPNEERLRSALVQLAEAVHAIHAHGMIHRDIKPSNVLVRPDGVVVVLDFGLVVDVDSERSLAMSAGSPAFMAPEQARGEPVGPEADWYAVGGILYQALTGRLPFDGSSIDVLLRKQTEAPVHPSRIVPGVPEELADLAMRLLDIAPAKRPTSAQVLAELGSARTRATSEASTEIFVGRDRELAALRGAFDASARGLAVARVHAPSGMGKTSLVRAFLREAGASATVLVGRCYEREQVPYKAFDHLVESLTGHLASMRGVDAAALMPRDVDALVRLFPGLLRVDVVRHVNRPRDRPHDRTELRRCGARALREMLQRLGDARRTVLFIDDVQWSDDDSAIVLAELLAPPDAPRMLLVLAYRDGDADRSALLRAVPRDNVSLTDVSLGPLERDVCVRIADEVGAGDRADRIADESGGSPLFLLELARNIASSPRVSLAEVLLERIHALPRAAQRILEIVAISGSPIRRPLALRAAGIEGRDDFESMMLLRRENLLRVRDGDELETFHDRVRDAVVGALDEAALREKHAALARVLAEEERTPPQALAYHCRLAGDEARARVYAERAGDEALRMLAFERAAEHYAAAITTESGRGELVEKLADALAGAGRGREAAETLLRASALRAGDDADEMRQRAAEQYLRTGLFEEGIETVRPLLREAGLVLPRGRWTLILISVWNIVVLTILGTKMAKRVVPGARRRAQLCAMMTLALGTHDPLRACLFNFYACREARRSGDVELLESSRVYYGFMLGRTKALLPSESPDGAELTPALRFWRCFANDFLAGLVAGSQGHPGVAAASLRRVEDAAQGGHLAFERSLGRIWLMDAIWSSGELTEHARRAHDHLLEYRSRGDVYGETLAEMVWIRRVHLVEGRPAEAVAIAERHLARATNPDHALFVLARLSVAESALYVGTREAAARARAELDVAARESMMPRVKSQLNWWRFSVKSLQAFASAAAGDAAEAARTARTLVSDGNYGGAWFAEIVRLATQDGEAGAAGYDAIALAMTADYPMHAEAARLRSAELRGDEAALTAAIRALAARGVAEPRRFVNVLVPRPAAF